MFFRLLGVKGSKNLFPIHHIQTHKHQTHCCCKRAPTVSTAFQDFFPASSTLASMEEIQFNTFHQDPETLFSNPSASRGFDWEKDGLLNQENKDSHMDEDGESLVDSMICDSGSRLIPTGFKRSDCAG